MIRKTRGLIGVAVTVVVAVSCAACSSGSSAAGGSDSKQINILAITDTTGPTKAYGAQELAGIEAAAKYYNGNGGIDGRKVVVKHISDNGDPSNSTSLAIKELSANPTKYTMVYPGAEGSTVAALIPIMAKYKVLAISLDDGDGVCAEASKCPHQFSNLGPTKLPQVKAADWMKSKGFKKVGILEESIAYTQGETPSFVSALTASGIANTKSAFPSSAVDLTAQLSKLKAAGADAVFAEALGPAAGYVLKARASLGWNVPILFDIAGSALDITTLVPKADTANAFTTLCPCADSAVKTPGLKALKSNAPSGTLGTVPANLVGDGWDSVVLLNAAVTQAKSTDYTKLTSAIENLSNAGQNDPLYMVTRHKKFTSANHENVASTADDFSITPVAPIAEGQAQASH